MASAVRAFMASEKASPSRVAQGRPAAAASRSKARLLYQPAVAVLVSAGGFSKETPMVAAPPPKAATMREAKP